MALLAFMVVADGQSTSGFLNIDCGKPRGYVDTDNETGLVYSDFEFIDTGEIHNASSELTTSLNSQLHDLRSFPNANRNCYVLRPVTKGSKYLLRATFFYGNYDGQDRTPQFDLYLGINLWRTVRLSTSSLYESHEIIAFATSDSMSVCLVNTNTGTPIISALELRPLNDTEYSVFLKTSQSLILYYRGDFGGTGTTRTRLHISVRKGEEKDTTPSFLSFCQIRGVEKSVRKGAEKESHDLSFILSRTWCVDIGEETEKDMESFVPARSLLLVVLLAFVVVADGRSTSGFLNIDCGKPKGYLDTDNETGLVYSSDFEFTDAGEVHNVSSEYSTSSNSQLHDLRSFPNANRNCYVLRPVTKGSKYLVRATFIYGNYDGQDRPPQFDLYLGIYLWGTVNLSTSSELDREEILAYATSDSISVCLVNTNTGTPLISALELRPLYNNEYPDILSTSQSLILYYRGDFGGTGTTRYPEDIFDRIWEPFNESDEPDEPDWRIQKTQSAINTNNSFDPPLAVMQTALTPRTGSSLDFNWDLSEASLPSTAFHLVLHFAEVERLGVNTRIFNVTLTDDNVADSPFYNNYSPNTSILTVYNREPRNTKKKLNVSLLQTSQSTLPPILNAVELFMALDITESVTDDSDADAINRIKTLYQLKRNWMGDPCLPKRFTWDGLNCSYANSNNPIIISLNLSSSGLTGEIPMFLVNLTRLETLDLSRNDLTGSIPDFLASLSSLTLLDLRGNKLEGTIPKSLLDKSAAGILQLRTGDIPNLCTSTDSCQPNEEKKSKKVVVIAVAVGCVAVIIILVAVILFWVLKKRNQESATNNIRSGNGISRSSSFRIPSFRSESRQFTFTDLVRITSNFNNQIGRGGFGPVFHAVLEDNTEVAVKMLSRSSSQGTREFQTEAQLLTRIHHRSLVRLVGYCNDMNHLALVYEYMAGGSLKDHLSGEIQNAHVLSWRQRLGISIEAAQGLEYLHKGCKPSIFHRDVKTSNILLTGDLEAKIADFGFSKLVSNDGHTHVSTRVIGTPGYLDPEYSITNKLNDKSDVYSFGIVLLELITGLPAIIRSTKSLHISQWVQPHIEKGEITEIVDKTFQGEFNINSIWKAVEIAFACISPASIQRPSMSEVLMLLKECFELETRQEGSQYPSNANLDYSSIINLATSNSMPMKIASVHENSIANPTPR